MTARPTVTFLFQQVVELYPSGVNRSVINTRGGGDRREERGRGQGCETYHDILFAEHFLIFPHYDREQF